MLLRNFVVVSYYNNYPSFLIKYENKYGMNKE